MDIEEFFKRTVSDLYATDSPHKNALPEHVQLIAIGCVLAVVSNAAEELAHEDEDRTQEMILLEWGVTRAHVDALLS